MDEILDGWEMRDGISWFYIFYPNLNALWGNNNNLAKGLFFVCFSDSTIALCKPIMLSTCRFHTMSLFNLTKYVTRPNVLKIIIESTHLSLQYIYSLTTRRCPTKQLPCFTSPVNTLFVSFGYYSVHLHVYWALLGLIVTWRWRVCYTIIWLDFHLYGGMNSIPIS